MKYNLLINYYYDKNFNTDFLEEKTKEFIEEIKLENHKIFFEKNEKFKKVFVTSENYCINSSVEKYEDYNILFIDMSSPIDFLIPNIFNKIEKIFDIDYPEYLYIERSNGFKILDSQSFSIQGISRIWTKQSIHGKNF